MCWVAARTRPKHSQITASVVKLESALEVGVSLFPSYHGATLPGVDRRGVVSNTLAPLAGVFVLERHIRRVRVGRVT